MMLHSGVGWSVLLCVLRLFCVSSAYFPRDAHQDFSFVRVRPEANAFKEGHEDVKGALCSQTGSLYLTNRSSTISLHATANSQCVAYSSIVRQNHSCITASTQILNMRLDSGLPLMMPKEAPKCFPKLPPARQTICALSQNVF
jgi:hypothetical protein